MTLKQQFSNCASKTKCCRGGGECKLRHDSIPISKWSLDHRASGEAIVLKSPQVTWEIPFTACAGSHLCLCPREMLETLLKASGFSLLSSHAEINGNVFSCLPVWPLPFFVKPPADTSCSNASPPTGSDFLNDCAWRRALVPAAVLTAWKHKWLQWVAGQESLSITGEMAATWDVLVGEKAAPPRCSPLVLLLAMAIKRLSPAQCGCPPSNKCPFLPSYTVLIHFLLNRFIALTSNLPAAAALVPNPPLSLSAQRGCPSQPTAVPPFLFPCSRRQAQTKGTWKYTFGSCG